MTMKYDNNNHQKKSAAACEVHDPHERAKKAADTRKRNEGENVFKEMGKRGSEERNKKSDKELSEIAQRAAATRKENDPDAFKKMGEKGGKASGGHSKDRDEE